jgi:aminoglycoside phosphotransferase
MSDNLETITIKDCPLCHNSHSYYLRVERSVIIKMVTMNDFNEQPQSVRKMRLFTCPIKNEEYQASITLSDTSSNRIKSIDVVGLK